MRRFLKNHWEVLILLTILLAGAFLRLYKIADYMTFLGDEGRDVLVVKRMIVDHKFTLLGPTASVGGFFLGPIYYYFMLPFLFLWRLDPVGPAVMVALFGIATIYLVYRVGKDFFHPAVGFVAASLYAFSPVAIAYSRSSWNPNLVPFFSTLLVYHLWTLVTKKQKYTTFVIGIILGIGLQLHYLFSFLGVVTLLWMVMHRRAFSIGRELMNLVGGFLIGYAPFLAFELRHGFPNTQSIIKFLAAGSDTGVSGNFLTIITDVVYRLFGRLLYRLPQPEWWVRATPLAQLSWNIGIWTTLIGSLAAVFFTFKQKTLRVGTQLLLVWFVVIVTLFGFYQKNIYDYYFGVFFPVPFLLLGVLFWQVGKQKLIAGLVALVWAGILWFNYLGNPFTYPPNRQLAQVQMIARAAYDKAEGKPFNFALDANFNSDHAYRYFFEIWGNPPVTIQSFEADPERKSVTDQLIIICEQPECHPLGHPLWEIAGFGRAEIAGSWKVSFITIYRLIRYRGEE